MAGAVLIELSGVSSLRRTGGLEQVRELAGRMMEIVRAQNAGFYRGLVCIPESTTLIFHSASPETLWSALEPCVRADPVAAGARITIRDSATHREVVVPMPMAAVN